MFSTLKKVLHSLLFLLFFNYYQKFEKSCSFNLKNFFKLKEQLLNFLRKVELFLVPNSPPKKKHITACIDTGLKRSQQKKIAEKSPPVKRKLGLL